MGQNGLRRSTAAKPSSGFTAAVRSCVDSRHAAIDRPPGRKSATCRRTSCCLGGPLRHNLTLGGGARPMDAAMLRAGATSRDRGAHPAPSQGFDMPWRRGEGLPAAEAGGCARAFAAEIPILLLDERRVDGRPARGHQGVLAQVCPAARASSSLIANRACRLVASRRDGQRTPRCCGPKAKCCMRLAHGRVMKRRRTRPSSRRSPAHLRPRQGWPEGWFLDQIGRRRVKSSASRTCSGSTPCSSCSRPVDGVLLYRDSARGAAA